MTYVVAHFLIPIILLKLAEIILPIKKFKRNHYILVGFFGIFPDLDLGLVWLQNLLAGEILSNFHRLYMHNLFFLAALILFALYFKGFKKNQYATIFFLFSFGVGVHLLLDILTWRMMPFYPVDFTFYGWHMFDIGNLGPKINALFDAFLFLCWMIYLLATKKIKAVI